MKQITGLAEKAIKNKKQYKAFMGVSIRNKFFSKKNIKEYFLWANEYFSEFLLVLMDDPDRHNIAVFKNIEEDKALTKAREIAQYSFAAYNKIINDMRLNNIKIITFSDLINFPLFTSTYFQISKAMEDNVKLKIELMVEMEKNINGKLINLLKNITSKQIAEKIKKQLVAYLMEECIGMIKLDTRETTQVKN